LWLDNETLETFGIDASTVEPCRSYPHNLQFQKTHVEMLLGLRQGDTPAQEAEEVLLDVLEHLLDSPTAGRPPAHGTVAARQVARAEEAIIGHAGENLSVEALAKFAGCSPFHLCRIFRSGTGQSLRQFRLQQRLGTALGRLGEGEDDLAALACDVGFSSHSHMSDAFRQALGKSPREMREELRRADLRVLRARLTSLPRAGCRPVPA